MKAGRLILIVFLACVLAAAGVLTYKRWPGLKNSVKRESANSSNQEQLSSVPPFSTREPDRYQAMRVITSVDGDSGTAPSITRILLARDGDRRREDYDSDTDFPTSYLETAAGTFILLPAKKLYVDIKSTSGGLALPNQKPDQNSDTDADFSPERLLNETPGQARYEKLGVEKLDGQDTTKYRVTRVAATNGTEAPTATLIWIDETLGMPIRSETDSANDNHRAKLTIELREIKLQVDPQLFELPKDYKQVEYSEFLDQLRQTRFGESRERAKP